MTLPSIDHVRLRALALVETLAETSSLHQAAKRLNTSQPALTVMLRDLERALGTPLFERSRRGLVPTANGNYMILQARLILADLRRLQGEFAEGLQGRSLLRVGALQLLMLEVVPRALSLLRRSMPMVRVELEEGAAGDLLRELTSGSLDLVVGRMLPEFAGNSDLEPSLLLNQSFCIIGGTHHPLARRRKLSWQELHEAAWIQSPPNTALRDYFVEAFLRHGLRPPQPLYQSASFYSCIGILQTSDCLMMVPHEVGRHFSGHAAIRVLSVPVDAPPTPFSLIKRRSRTDMPGLMAFEDAIRHVVLERNGAVAIKRSVRQHSL